MRILGVLSALLAVATLASTASAQQAGITYDCDTASDHFSELVLPVPPAPFVVTGEVRLAQIAPIGKYAPLTRLRISDAPPAPGQSSKEVAGFELNALPAKALKLKTKDDKAVVQFIGWDEWSGGSERKHDPAGLVEYTDSLAFSLAYDGSAVTVRIAGKEQVIPLATNKPVVRLICSTGEFLYTNLKIEPKR